MAATKEAGLWTEETLHNIPMPSPKAPPSIYRLKVTLTELEPPIWRRIEVPSTILLCCLHDALQP
jgi:hypothetical protein